MPAMQTADRGSSAMRLVLRTALALLHGLPVLAESPPPAGPMFLNSPSVWSALPFSEAVRVGETLYLSG